MKTSLINQIIVVIGILFTTVGFGQNLRWSFSVNTLTNTTSEVKVYLQNISTTTPEKINSFSTIFYYNDTQSDATSFDLTSTTNNLWPNNGTSSSTLHYPHSNPNVSISHTGFSTINLTDTRQGTPGKEIPPNSSPIHVLTINFTNQNPPSNGWFTETDEYAGMAYSNENFDEFPIILLNGGIQFAPLPIKLLSFTATKATETSVNLNWTTSSEQNSDYYGVERSQDGVNWTEIGIVDAVGNSDTKMYYDFNDNELPANNRTFHHQLYYKLRLVDQDGKFAYSDVRVVQLDNKNTNHTFNIYPNPSLKFFNINLSGISSEYGDIQMRIFDTMGKLVLEKKMLGGGIELLDMQDYPTGIYLVKIIQGSKQFESRISKI